MDRIFESKKTNQCRGAFILSNEQEGLTLQKQMRKLLYFKLDFFFSFFNPSKHFPNGYMTSAAQSAQLFTDLWVPLKSNLIMKLGLYLCHCMGATSCNTVMH